MIAVQRFLFSLFFIESGGHLFSHTVSSAVPSAAYVLTVVFGMGTGVSRKRIATRSLLLSVTQLHLDSAPLHLDDAGASYAISKIRFRKCKHFLPGIFSLAQLLDNQTTKQPLLLLP